MEVGTQDLREIVAELKADGLRCNCDLDNWEPERTTGHSWVCRIHKQAVKLKDYRYHMAGGQQE